MYVLELLIIFSPFDFIFLFLKYLGFAAMSRKVESDDESSSVDELEQSSDEFVPSASETDSSETEEDSDSSDSENVTLHGTESNLKINIPGKKKIIDVDLPYVSIIKVLAVPKVTTRHGKIIRHFWSMQKGAYLN